MVLGLLIMMAFGQTLPATPPLVLDHNCPCRPVADEGGCWQGASLPLRLDDAGEVDGSSQFAKDLRIMARAVPGLKATLYLPPQDWLVRDRRQGAPARVAAFLHSAGIPPTHITYVQMEEDQDGTGRVVGFVTPRGSSVAGVEEYRLAADTSWLHVGLSAQRTWQHGEDTDAPTLQCVTGVRRQRRGAPMARPILPDPVPPPDWQTMRKLEREARKHKDRASVFGEDPCADERYDAILGPADDTAALVGALDRIPINDRCAHVVMFRLKETEALTPAQEMVVLRFLESSQSDNWSLALSVLRRSGNPRLVESMRAAAAGDDSFRAARASLFLLERGDADPFNKLRASLHSPKTPLLKRQELLQRMDMFERAAPSALLDDWIQLLRSPEVSLRYGAFQRLRAATGNVFGYAYRLDASGNAGALAAWKQWRAGAGALWKPAAPMEDPRPLAGLGAVVGMRGGKTTIISVVPGLPAARAGIVEGETLMAVNGDPTDGKSLADLIEFELRGEPGTAVTLTVLGLDASPREVPLTRQVLGAGSVVTVGCYVPDAGWVPCGNSDGGPGLR